MVTKVETLISLYSNLEHALVYYDMGFNIIPLWEQHYPDECRKDGEANASHVCPDPPFGFKTPTFGQMDAVQR